MEETSTDMEGCGEKAVNLMRDRLVALINEAKDEYPTIPSVNCCKPTFAYYLANHLLANGVIVPPCKVGDIVYAVSLNTETNIVAVHRGYIGSIDIRSSGNYIFICHEGFDDEPYFKSICGKFEDFGETVFLTREEAEQALKGEHHAEIH